MLSNISIFKKPKAFIYNIPQSSGKMRSTKEKKIGRDYIPPMTAITLNVASHAMRSLRGISDVPVEARTKFSWTDKDDVKKYKQDLNLPSDFMSPVYNQSNCGSCWAVSTAQVFADRWAIANKVSNPQFSPTFLLSCSMKYLKESEEFKNLSKDYWPMDGCMGGLPSEAVDFINRIGIAKNECWNYNWCNKNNKCFTNQSTGAGGDLNDLLPACPQYNICSNYENGTFKTSSTDKIYKCKKWSDVKSVQVPDIYFQKIDDATKTVKTMSSIGSAKTFAPLSHRTREEQIAYHQNVINDIKEEIFKRGPVVACFDIIYATFFRNDGTHPPTFLSSTWIDDLYINVDSNKLSDYYDRTPDAIGGHAVAIVGWGEKMLTFDKVPAFLRQGVSVSDKEYQRILDVYKSLKGKTIPYWIVRNSWGDEDIENHTNGYFKIAMSNVVIGFNNYPAIDVPKTKGGALFGGVTAMLPELSSEIFTNTNSNSISKHATVTIASGKECGKEGPSSDVLNPLFSSSTSIQENSKSFIIKHKVKLIIIMSIMIVIILFFYFKNK